MKKTFLSIHCSAILYCKTTTILTADLRIYYFYTYVNIYGKIKWTAHSTIHKISFTVSSQQTFPKSIVETFPKKTAICNRQFCFSYTSPRFLVNYMQCRYKMRQKNYLRFNAFKVLIMAFLSAQCNNALPTTNTSAPLFTTVCAFSALIPPST